MERITNILNIIRPSLGKGLGMGLLLLSLFSCDSIDCTINNVVSLTIAFYDSDTKKEVQISDTLNVTAEGTDSLLYNRGIKVKNITVPMSYWLAADTLNLDFYNVDTDTHHPVTLQIDKTNVPHYESPDCPTTMFHQIQNVKYTSTTNYVDSVIVVNPFVNYNAQENIRIYLHPAS